MISDKPLLVIGGGGHAKVLLDTIKLIGSNILGIIDSAIEPNNMKHDLHVLGDDKKVYDYNSQEILLVNGLGALPGKTVRWQLAEKFRKDGYRYATIIHPSAIIGSGIKMDEGVQIMAGCVIQPDVKIGRDTIVNTGTTIDHDCVIGPSCHLAPGVTLSGSVTVGGYVHIGTGANVIQQINIADESVIPAGSTVVRDLPMK